MKTLLGTLLALGLLSTAASAQWCPPGYGYRTTTVVTGAHRPAHATMPAPVEAAPIEPTAPAAPIEPAPIEPAPEAAPPK
jgi:hypothetical protein